MVGWHQDDRNFLLTVSSPATGDESKDCDTTASTPRRLVLKVHNGVDSQNTSFIEAQNLALVHVAERGFNVPSPLATIDGALTGFYSLPLLGSDGSKLRKHAVRLLNFVEGTVMSEVKPTLALLSKVPRGGGLALVRRFQSHVTWLCCRRSANELRKWMPASCRFPMPPRIAPTPGTCGVFFLCETSCLASTTRSARPWLQRSLTRMPGLLVRRPGFVCSEMYSCVCMCVRASGLRRR